MGANLLDFLVWGVLLLFSVKGFLKGLVREICSLLGLVTGGWAAFRYASPLSTAVGHSLPLPHSVSVILTFVLILLASMLLFSLCGYLVTAVFRLVCLGGANRIGGTALGFCEGALLLSIVLAFGTSPLSPASVRQKVEASTSARPFAVCGREILAGWQQRQYPPLPFSDRR
jgi:membrane protein required for colicin V production